MLVDVRTLTPLGRTAVQAKYHEHGLESVNVPPLDVADDTQTDQRVVSDPIHKHPGLPWQLEPRIQGPICPHRRLLHPCLGGGDLVHDLDGPVQPDLRRRQEWDQ